MTRRTPALGWLLALCASCSNMPAQGQFVVHVDTDAPLPCGADQVVSPQDPAALFDRIRFEVFEPGHSAPCASCTSDFAATRDLFGNGGPSIGVLPAPGRDGYRIRVKLYREEFTELDEGFDRTTLQATVALPPIEEGRISHVTIFLSTEMVSVERGTPEDPISANEGLPGSTRVGTWSGAQRIGCDREPSTGEVCVPGGAFWMGHPFVAGGLGRDDEPWPHLVVVSPFYLDETEVKVGDFRRWFVARYGTPAANDHDDDPARRPADFDVVPQQYCNFPRDLSNDEFDDMPLNCVGYERAREYCRLRDASHPADLPTEAQLEYAAGALESRLYVWGHDEPGCGDAIYARAPGAGRGLRQFPGECRFDTLGGPARSCSGLWDILMVGSERVCDLAGNLAELARDAWTPQRSPCWGDTALLRDPLCTQASTERTTRGGSWVSEPHELRAAYRAAVPDAFPTSVGDENTNLGPLIGFRCARSAVPVD